MSYRLLNLEYLLEETYASLFLPSEILDADIM